MVLTLQGLKTKKKRFSIEKYHEMIAAGIFDEKDKIELINGEIYEMSPVSSGHAGMVLLVSTMLNQILAGKALINGQNPIFINENSEPEPDIAVLKLKSDFYRKQLPTSEDIYFIIEVAKSSLEYDQTIKAELYAAAAIEEYWIINLENNCIEVYKKPEREQYKVREIYFDTDQISLPHFGNTIQVKDILG